MLFRPLAIAAFAALLAGPAAAQTERGPDLREGLEGFLRDMMRDMGPALDRMMELMRAIEEIDDPRHYQMPEVQPNGDIIIRRHPDAPPYRPDPMPLVPEGGVKT